MDISSHLIAPIWQAYGDYFNNSPTFAAERYKWKVLRQVYEKWHWNADADNSAMFAEAFHVTGPKNLWSSVHFYPVTMFGEMLDELPEMANAAMSLLLNEALPLGDRLRSFLEQAEAMRATLANRHPEGNKNNHFHGDMRAVSLYLTLQFPEKYFLYKSGIYTRLCKYFGLNAAGDAIAKYLHYLEIADTLRRFIQQDTNFMARYKQFVADPQHYEDADMQLLIQDFSFYVRYYYKTSDEKPITSYWLFQGNPKTYDVVAALKAKALKSWTVTAHKEKIKPGDKVILWVTGEKSGCYALCNVTSEVENRMDDDDEQQFYTDKSKNESHDRVALEVEYNFSDHPILKEQMASLPEFVDFNAGNQGTNFTATKEQYDQILELHWENRLLINFKEVADRKKIEWFCHLAGKIVTKFDLEPENQRIIFSTPNSYINSIAITMGQRYVLYLSNKNSANKPSACFNMICMRKDLDVFKQQMGFVSIGEFKSKSAKESPPYNVYFDETGFPREDQLINAWLDAIAYEYQRTEKSSYRQHHNPMLFKAVVDAQYREYILDKIFKSDNTMESIPLNQILYGPPGTGKTYKTIDKALEIIDPVYYETYKDDRKLLKKRFDELLIKNWESGNTGQIAFVTFHQSMSYEDFIEGIKPSVLAVDEDSADESESISYRIEKGIFRKICMKAATNAAVPGTFDQLWKSFTDYILHTKEEVIFKSTSSELKLEPELSTPDSLKLRFKRSWNNSQEEGQTVFHVGKATIQRIFNQKLNLADPDLRKWVAIRDIVGSGRATTFLAVYSKFFEYSNLAATFKQVQKELPYVLIIDEINRGNISQIFGELITLIEEDKRLGAKEALQTILPYSKEKFGVPPNLYLIGTMNTADRSIEALDTALRRRFTFVEMSARPEIIKEHSPSDGMIDGVDLVLLLSAINSRIEKLLDKDHQIGHSYLMNIHNLDGLKLAFKNKIIPLLEEYFYGDFAKIGLVLGNDFVIQKPSNDFSFAAFSGIDNEVAADLHDRKVYQITPSESWTAEDFQSVYSNKSATAAS